MRTTTTSTETTLTTATEPFVERVGFLPEVWGGSVFNSFSNDRMFETTNDHSDSGREPQIQKHLWVPLSDLAFTHQEMPVSTISWMWRAGRDGYTQERIVGIAMVPLAVASRHGRYYGVNIHPKACRAISDLQHGQSRF